MAMVAPSQEGIWNEMPDWIVDRVAFLTRDVSDAPTSEETARRVWLALAQAITEWVALWPQ